MTRQEIAPLVHADIDARIAKGEAEYGEKLTSHNGRDPLQDAYEECLDQAMYLKQAMVELADSTYRKGVPFAKPVLRGNNSTTTWEVKGPAFTHNPAWDGIRRAWSKEDAYNDWKAMYIAYATIYRVKGLPVPVA